jgi:hypothetical protein
MQLLVIVMSHPMRHKFQIKDWRMKIKIWINRGGWQGLFWGLLVSGQFAYLIFYFFRVSFEPLTGNFVPSV